MVLINIDNLSDSELRYIAKQEELEDWESLSREDLIEALEYLYESDGTPQTMSGSSERKFVKTLTDVAPDNMLALPGVEELQQHYNETSIHLVMKSFNWAYVFWSLSAQQKNELEELGASLVLRTLRYDESGNENAVYDIEIGSADSCWTVELPYLGFTYKVCLIAKTAEEETVICQSNSITTTNSYLGQNASALADKDCFRKMFASLITKGGEVLANKQVQDLVEQYKEACK
ncbi:MAG: DUF4912 domain-containing protein [Sphaerochaetaceae bacterium]|nr:DUF4912 domain-containing protein [Sphaerochaetaceae bacterium]